MNIRTETEQDFPIIYDFVKKAFETAKVSDGDEQDFVNKLRAGGRYIPELALVAEENGEIIGHIMLTKTYVVEGDTQFEGLLLAPLAVALEYRNKGIGNQLVKEAFRKAKELGYTAVFLAGDPAYYSRFGFKPTVDFGIKHTFPVDDCYIMACELIPDALNEVTGTAQII